MRDKRRNSKLIPQLESMDSRVVPSMVGPGHGVHAQAVLARHAAVNVHHAMGHQHAIQVHPRLRALATRREAVAQMSATVSPTATRLSIASPTVAVSSMQTPAPSTSGINTVTTPVQPSATVQTSATTDMSDVKNGPLAKAGKDLIAIYLAYGPSGTGTPPSGSAAAIEVVGTSVGVTIRSSGDLNTLVAAMNGLGMQIQSSNANTHMVSGLLPIAQLPTVAQQADITSITPIYAPQLG